MLFEPVLNIKFLKPSFFFYTFCLLFFFKRKKRILQKLLIMTKLLYRKAVKVCKYKERWLILRKYFWKGLSTNSNDAQSNFRILRKKMHWFFKNLNVKIIRFLYNYKLFLFTIFLIILKNMGFCKFFFRVKIF